MKLVDVYSDWRAPIVLYKLLKERDPKANISHRKLPTYDDHKEFVYSHPYKCWYLIRADSDYVGAIYLSKDNEIGIFIFHDRQRMGYGKRAILQLMNDHPQPRFLANVAPTNPESIAMFERMGFRPIQNTYELRHDSREL